MSFKTYPFGFSAVFKRVTVMSIFQPSTFWTESSKVRILSNFRTLKNCFVKPFL